MIADQGRMNWRDSVLTYLLSFGLVILITAVIIVVLGHDPLTALRSAMRDSIGTIGGIGQTLNRMAPLLLASLTFAVGMHAGLQNIGMDGQIYVGAIFATAISFALADSGLSIWVMLPLVMLAGMAGGAAWAAVPGALFARWGVSEIFTTVMFNFIAIYLVEMMTTGAWHDPMAGDAITKPIPAAATLPMLLVRGGAHWGVLIACVTAALFWWLLYRTVFGYEFRATGASVRAARVGGISVQRMQFAALLVGGAISGLAGAIELTGVYQRLIVGLSPGFGYMAILIAVVGRYSPMGLIPVNLIFALLISGTDSLQRTVGFPQAAVFMLQAVVVLAILGLEAYYARKRRFAL